MENPIKNSKAINTKSNNFRIQNQKLHFTYSSHIPPKAWISWITKTKKKPLKYYSIVHETSEDNYKHTHILVDFGKTIQTRKSTYFDWPIKGKPIHPNIKVIQSKKHWINTAIYHYKQNIPESNFDKPEPVNPIKDVWSHSNISDAILNTCTTLNNVGGVIAAFKCKPKDYGMEPNVKWNQWQQELMTEIENDPDPRRIIWYYDHYGSAGKTFLAKHMGMYKNAFVSTKANTYHVATSVDEFLHNQSVNNEQTFLIIIFNFTRQQENHRIYQALEELKDGMITSEKYKGKTIFFPKIPHVICMANYIPEIECFSKDRWDIRALENEKVVKRIVGGKIIIDDPNIDPYIDYTLKDVTSSYENLDNYISDPDYNLWLQNKKNKDPVKSSKVIHKEKSKEKDNIVKPKLSNFGSTIPNYNLEDNLKDYKIVNFNNNYTVKKPITVINPGISISDLEKQYKEKNP